MKRKLVGSIACVCLILALGVLLVPACAQKAAPSPTPAAPTQVITWKFHSGYKDSYMPGAQHKDFAKRVEEESNGRMKIDIFFDSTLGYKGPEVMAVLKQGLLDVTELGAATSAEEVAKWWSWGDFYSLFDNYDQVRYVQSKVFPLMEQDINRYGGIKTISLCGSDPAETMEGFWMNTKFESLADIQGKVIRCYYPMGIKYEIEKIGASGIFIPGSECYHALKTGLVDVILQTATAGITNKYYEISKYFYVWEPISFGNWGIVASQKSFDALPADLQTVVVKAGKEHEKFVNEELLPHTADYVTGEKLGGEYCDKTAIEFLKQQAGLKLYRVDKFHDLMAGLAREGLKAWADDTGYPEAKQVYQWLMEAAEKFPGLKAETYNSLESGAFQ